MTRLPFLALVSFSVLAACSTNNAASTNPDAGKYDDYYSETKSGGGSDAGGGGTSADSGDKPGVRTVTSTKGAPTRKAKSLAARKPPVGGGGKGPRKPTKPLSPGDALALDGFFPTNAPAGSVIEVFGSGFTKGKTGVTIGKKRQKVLDVVDGVMTVQLTGDVNGPLVINNAGARGKKQTTIVKSETAFHTVDGFGTPRTTATNGLVGNVYRIASPVTELPAADTLGEPFATFAVDNLDMPSGQFNGSFAGADGEVSEWFAIHFRGSLNVTAAGNYDLCLNAGDGALLFLDQTPIVDNDGVHDTTEKCESLAIEPGEYQLDVMWFQAAKGELGLQLTWAKDGGAKAPIPKENLFPPEDVATVMLRK